MTVVYFSNSFTGKWQCELNDNSCEKKKKQSVFEKRNCGYVNVHIFFLSNRSTCKKLMIQDTSRHHEKMVF